MKKIKDYDCLNINDYADMNTRQKRRCKKERAEQGFCWWDVYDMDIWFINIIPRMLEYFKEHNNAFPVKLKEEYYEKYKDKTTMTKEEFYLGKKNETDEDEKFREDCDNYCFARWDEIIDEMIYLFNEYNDDKCSNKIFEFEHTKDMKEYKKSCLKQAFELFAKWIDNLWI